VTRFSGSKAAVDSNTPLLGQADAPVLEAPDEASAAVLAYRVRKPVAVTGLTSETSRVWAQPDGTFRSELHAAPVRTRDTSGAWVDVDLMLQRHPDGSVTPRAHPQGLRLSGARGTGSDDLVVVGSGALRSTLGWRGPLPEPALGGPRATYGNVRPGVDLVVEARRGGFRYSFVVRTAQAAAELSTVSMPWSVGSATGAAASRVTEPGSSVTVSQGEMWDARVTPSGDPLHRADVAVSTQTNTDGGQDLVLTPDPGFYQEPQLTYPVTIDPSVDLEPGFDTYVQNTISNTDKSGDDEIRLGYSDDATEGCGSGCTARSLLNFQRLGGFEGAQVVSAELLLWNFYSWSCTATSWQSWRVSGANSSARWGNQPSWLEVDGTSTGTKGYGGCGAGWVSVSVKKSLQAAFDDPEMQWAYIGLRATSESNHNGWKKFNSSEASSHTPYVAMVYNREPGVPTGQRIDSCYSACGSPAIVRSGTPQLWATVSDPDGGVLRAEYEVYNSTMRTMKARSGTTVTGVASGSAKPWRVVPISEATLPDGLYHWRAKACDTYGCGDYTGWFAFTVNTQDPSLPTVSGTPYVEKSTGTWSGGPGQAGTFSFAPNGAAEVGEYVYSLNNGPSVTIAAGTPQAQLLTANQQQVSSGTTGFTAGVSASIARSTVRGHNSGESLQITPVASGGAGAPFNYATVGGEWSGGFHLGMQAGKRYSITGWIYVPAATGLNPPDARALSIVSYYYTGGSGVQILSPRPTVTDAWQRISMSFSIPSTATEAFIRLYNGFAPGSGKSVFWDDLSVREVIGDSTVDTIVPTKDGTNVLSVQSRTAAGATSDPRVYQFLVNPSADEWNWTFDQDSAGTATSVPGAFPATYSPSGVSPAVPGRVGEAAVTLDGTGHLSTASPVLNTIAPAGFTVAAWARLTDLTASRTVVSQDGANTSMFRLGYRNDLDLDGDTETDQAWCFTATTSDSPTADSVAACTTDYVVEGDWVSLVGTYDRAAGQISLYVNGTPMMGGTVVEVGYADGWSATGPLAIGRAASTDPQRWVGDIDHVYAAQRVWESRNIDLHAFQ
jgi:hypothetical protein